jgi:hypothetical protein
MRQTAGIMDLRFLLLLLSLAFCSCVTGGSDNFGLLSRIEKNPDPKAIIGMWHGRGTESSLAVLFRPDGTGIESNYSSDAIMGNQGESLTKFSWEYKGNGIWKAHSPTAWDYSLWTWSIANGNLVRNSGPPWFHSQVYERVTE